MAFIKITETKAGTIGIWELTEKPEVLLKSFNFTVSELKEYNKLRTEKRKTEYLAVRLLLEKIFLKKVEVSYNRLGKPFLKDNKSSISISHSAELAIVLVSNKKVGIDVEGINRDVKRILTRYLNSEELKHLENSENQQLLKIIYWCAKEAIFKCTDCNGVRFNKEIFIHPFIFENEGSFEGILKNESKTERYRLWSFICKNNVVVYCVDVTNQLK